MKLIKSLLPIAGLGCVAASVVPTITSCGSSSWINAVVDLDPEARGFKKCPAKDIPFEQLWTKYYVEQVQHDKQIVYDDFEYSSSLLGQLAKRVPEIVWKLAPSKDFAISCVHVNQFETKLWDFKLDVIQYMASYKVAAKIDYDVKLEIPSLKQHKIDPAIVLNFKADLKGQFNNAPFYICTDEISTLIARLDAEEEEIVKSKGLSFTLNPDRMVIDPYWNISLDVDASLKGVNKDIELGLDVKTDGTYTFDVHNVLSLLFKEKTLSTFVALLGGWSTYFYSEYEDSGRR